MFLTILRLIASLARRVRPQVPAMSRVLPQRHPSAVPGHGPPAGGAELEGRHDSVVEDATSAADLHLRRSSLTAAANLRLAVNAAIGSFLLMIVALETDEPSLAPRRAPRVLNLPILSPGLLAVSNERHRVVYDRVLLACVHDSVAVDVPLKACGKGDANGAALGKGLQQRLQLVLRQLLEPCHAELRPAAVAAHLTPFETEHGMRTSTIRSRVGHIADGAATCFRHVVHCELDGGTLAATLASALPGVRGARDDLLLREVPIFLVELGMGP